MGGRGGRRGWPGTGTENFVFDGRFKFVPALVGGAFCGPCLRVSARAEIDCVGAFADYFLYLHE